MFGGGRPVRNDGLTADNELGRRMQQTWDLLWKRPLVETTAPQSPKHRSRFGERRNDFEINAWFFRPHSVPGGRAGEAMLTWGHGKKLAQLVSRRGPIQWKRFDGGDRLCPLHVDRNGGELPPACGALRRPGLPRFSFRSRLAPSTKRDLIRNTDAKLRRLFVDATR